jgi:hypothetical protein
MGQVCASFQRPLLPALFQEVLPRRSKSSCTNCRQFRGVGGGSLWRSSRSDRLGAAPLTRWYDLGQRSSQQPMVGPPRWQKTQRSSRPRRTAAATFFRCPLSWKYTCTTSTGRTPHIRSHNWRGSCCQGNWGEDRRMPLQSSRLWGHQTRGPSPPQHRRCPGIGFQAKASASPATPL